MRNIKYIVLHCTATPQTTTVASIQRYWAENLRWKNPGYHYLIKPNGDIVQLLQIGQVSNGVAGYNSVSIHISYIGGVDADNKPFDNRTAAQISSQILLLRKMKSLFPAAEIKGHRDFSGVAKACPSFEVADFLKGINILLQEPILVRDVPEGVIRIN
jgi:N-acetylmuramoyl-L-alanine amidase